MSSAPVVIAGSVPLKAGGPAAPAKIRQQYDEMVKYATALRLGTAQAEAILRRFTRENTQHPTLKH